MKYFLLIALLFTSPVVFGQDAYQTNHPPKIVPVSPNAASLGIYGAIPVGHYTGVPNIAVPIYEIDLDGKKFPINISYHASGIKVAQEASPVGLGWALSAGGCIVKEVRGWDDFSPPTSDNIHSATGYHWDTSFPTPDANNNLNIITGNEDHWKYGMYMRNESDPEPDLFHFNFASFSGTMFFNKNTPKATIQKETDYLDASFNGSSWIIMDGNGFKYYFNTQETSEMRVRQESTYYMSLKSSYITRERQPIVVTAWYLDSIVSPYNNKISFSYEKESLYTPVSVSEDVSYLVDIKDNITAGSGPYSPHLDGAYRYYNYSYSKNEQTRLINITFSGGNLAFNYSDRLDLEAVNANAKPKKLNSIVINNTNSTVKNITFKQSYFGNTDSPLTCRLMLDALQIGINQDIQNYVFSYNQGELPNKESPATDYWGYYTLSGTPGPGSNFKLVPPMETFINGKVKFFEGRNKEVYENYLKHGVLTSIQYPTGGTTVFEYEAHDFQNSFFVYNPYKAELASIFYDTRETPQYIGDDFVIEDETRLFIELTSYIANPSIPVQNQEVKFYIEKKQNDDSYLKVESYQLIVDIIDDKTDTRTFVKTLPAGIYRLRMEPITNQSNAYIDVRAKKTVLNTISKGGGLRVKTITDDTGNDKLIQRTFAYAKNGKSTGLLMVTPIHHEYFLLSGEIRSYLNGLFSSGIDVVFDALYLNGVSSPYTPFGNSAMGGNVGYSYVEEKIIDTHVDNGKMAYTFYNKADSLVDVSDRPLKTYPSIPYLNNGSPLEISYLDKDIKVQKKTTFDYIKTKSASIKGIKLRNFPMATMESMAIKFYDLYSERWALNKTIDSVFVNNNSVVTTTNYQYSNSNWLVNSETTTNSANKTIEKQIKYPEDFNTTEPYSTMVIKNMLSPVIEQIITNNNTEASRIKTNYFKDAAKTNNLIVPQTIQTSTSGATNLRADITYNQYDAKGNVLQYTEINGVAVCYLWSYNSQYPIAEIKNATYAEVETAAKSVFSVASMDALSALVTPNETKLKDGSLQKALPHAQVTTFTYKPLVGILTSTDPHGVITTYEYDGFGRLQTIKDENSRAVENHDYHYKN
ncbi:MAG: RHS repeat protein [Candidatus Symbiothrix sp.]|jgi:YD repeat-containing protein|nr:RHS repeat protein [Candidatus Symbiothrix sp.]